MDRTPVLEPVKAFHEADAIEHQLKAMSLDVFREYLRGVEREINVYGAPHLGALEQVERWVKSDGIVITRTSSSSDDSIRYLFKAWRSRNPKRGLRFLRTYLQLLWPNAWEAEQLWQHKKLPYPTALYSDSELVLRGVDDPSKDYFLTSRVNVNVSTSTETGSGVTQVARSLRYVCGARFLVNLRYVQKSKSNIKAAATLGAFNILETSGKLQPYRIRTAEKLTAASVLAGVHMKTTSGQIKRGKLIVTTGNVTVGAFKAVNILISNGNLT